jgi:hypothetical protein
MAFIIRLLGAGVTNAGTLTVPYSVSSGASPSLLGAIVSNVRLVNTTLNPVTANVFYRVSGSPNQVRISDKDKSVAAGDLLLVKPELTMGVGDTIEATTSAAIDYVVCGVEKV